MSDRSDAGHSTPFEYCSVPVSEGAHLLVVEERLGHSTITVTADRYGHLFPSLEAALTVKLDATYRTAADGRAGSVR